VGFRDFCSLKVATFKKVGTSKKVGNFFPNKLGCPNFLGQKSWEIRGGNLKVYPNFDLFYNFFLVIPARGLSS